MPDFTTSSVSVQVEPLMAHHYPAVKQIYEEGMATGLATFQTEAPAWEAWDSGHLPFGRLVAIKEDQIAGWAALSLVSGRCVYSGVTEVSVYVGEHFRRLGIGKILLHQLIKLSEENGIWTIQAGIMKENTASIALHKSCGFRIVGLREKLGRLHGKWRDVYLMERRSQVVGM